MYLKIHEHPKGRIVAACDKELIGKVLEGKGACMDLATYRGFYMGKLADDKEIREALSSFGSANLVGEKAVEVAVSMGIVEEDDVMYINSTPYIQVYKL